ncbi:MAG: hypothetical protein ABSG31_18190 [Tepidisphaeraceae bacterium]|jgi:hypothetical protein
MSALPDVSISAMISFPPGAIAQEAASARAEIQRQFSDVSAMPKINVPIMPELTEFRRQLDATIAETGRREATVRTVADTSAAQSALDSFRATQQAAPIIVPIVPQFMPGAGVDSLGAPNVIDLQSAAYPGSNGPLGPGSSSLGFKRQYPFETPEGPAAAGLIEQAEADTALARSQDEIERAEMYREVVDRSKAAAAEIRDIQNTVGGPGEDESEDEAGAAGGGGGSGMGGMMGRFMLMHMAIRGMTDDFEAAQKTFNLDNNNSSGDPFALARQTLSGEKDINSIRGIGVPIHNFLADHPWLGGLMTGGPGLLAGGIAHGEGHTDTDQDIESAQQAIADAQRQEQAAQERARLHDEATQKTEELNRQANLAGLGGYDLENARNQQELNDRLTAAANLINPDQQKQQTDAANKIFDEQRAQLDQERNRTFFDTTAHDIENSEIAGGDPRAAARTRFVQNQADTRQDFLKIQGSNAPEAVANFDRAQKGDLLQFDKDQKKQLEAQEAESAARIADIQGHAREEMLRADHQAWEADQAEFKRASDDKVQALRDQAKAATDAAEATRLNAEADAQAAANAQEAAAREKEHTEQLQRQHDLMAAQTGVLGLQAQGHGFAASQAEFDAKQAEELRQAKIDAAKDGDPRHLADVQAKQQAERDARQADIQRGFDAQNLDAYKLNASAAGMDDLGTVAEVKAKIAEELKNAQGNAQAESVARNLAEAQIRAAQRSIFGSSRGGIYGSAEELESANFMAMPQDGSDGKMEAIKSLGAMLSDLKSGKNIGGGLPAFDAFGTAVDKFDQLLSGAVQLGIATMGGA